VCGHVEAPGLPVLRQQAEECDDGLVEFSGSTHRSYFISDTHGKNQVKDRDCQGWCLCNKEHLASRVGGNLTVLILQQYPAVVYFPVHLRLYIMTTPLCNTNLCDQCQNIFYGNKQISDGFGANHYHDHWPEVTLDA
jgi:hypothetical protein